MEYEYESFMENSYRVSMLKSFKKTVDDGYFPFIIVDAVNNKIRQFEEFWSYANSKGFQVRKNVRSVRNMYLEIKELSRH
jgi:YLP motif-containing protein 1